LALLKEPELQPVFPENITLLAVTKDGVCELFAEFIPWCHGATMVPKGLRFNDRS
jgi:hypothetical protein